MNKTNDFYNTRTQPLREHKIFNNWQVVTKGWYPALKSSELKIGAAKSLSLNEHKIVLFRGKSGEVYCLDAFCPHMGVDLGIGKVEGEELRCFFHHWKYNGRAQCTEIPCGEDRPNNLKLQSYATEEKYGQIWVWPDATTNEHVLDIPGLEDEKIVYSVDDPYERSCHYHITMINGIDPQHLSTVHNINIAMNIEFKEEQNNHIEIVLKGKFPTNTLKERLAKIIFGEEYSYSMKYADGCVAALTMFKGAKLFNKFNLPELHMIFAYSLIEKGRISVLPIYINKKSKGPLGFLFNFLKLFMTKAFFKMLQGEDGEVYDNIRFNTDAFLKMDGPVANYIGYINRLEASVWSK